MSNAGQDEGASPPHGRPAPASQGLAEIRRMRDAIAVALALLDEVLSAKSMEERDAFRDIHDIFRETAEMAAAGALAARQAAGQFDKGDIDPAP